MINPETHTYLFMFYISHDYLAQLATAVQVQATGLVCSRVLPVCRHRSVRYPLDNPASAINQMLSK